MTTNQPIWKCVGKLGDVDPVAYGGGYVYEDTTGVYPPELEWIVPASDDEWDVKGDDSVCTVYRLIIEKDFTREWWYEDLSKVFDVTPVFSDETMERAFIYDSLVGYYGPYEFDQYPNTFTEAEARERYASDEAELRRNK